MQDQVARLGEQGLRRERMGQVQSKLRLLLERRNFVKQLSAKRRDELTTSRLLCVFNRNATEVLKILSAPTFSIGRGTMGVVVQIQIQCPSLTPGGGVDIGPDAEAAGGL